MTTIARLYTATLIGSLSLAAALPSRAASQDDIFWRQLQRTDGVAVEQTQPPPQRAPGFAIQAPAPDHEWIVAELKKADGYIPEVTEVKRAAPIRKTEPGARSRSSSHTE